MASSGRISPVIASSPGYVNPQTNIYNPTSPTPYSGYISSPSSLAPKNSKPPTSTFNRSEGKFPPNHTFHPYQRPDSQRLAQQTPQSSYRLSRESMMAQPSAQYSYSPCNECMMYDYQSTQSLLFYRSINISSIPLEILHNIGHVYPASYTTQETIYSNIYISYIPQEMLRAFSQAHPSPYQ